MGLPQAGTEAAEAVASRRGLATSRVETFTSIRYSFQVPQAKLIRPKELTVQPVAERFRVSPNVVYYWSDRGGGGLTPDLRIGLPSTIHTNGSRRHSRSGFARSTPLGAVPFGQE